MEKKERKDGILNFNPFPKNAVLSFGKRKGVRCD